MFQKKKSAFLKSLEPAMKIGKIDGQIFYDPKTGVFIPARRIPPCPGGHSLTDLYWNPCLECEKFCNCIHTHWFPDIIVKTSDNDTIRVNPSSSRDPASLSGGSMNSATVRKGPW
ncbi:hypothetical protein Fcan01_26760 [Folsomia candida]|uniref:Uncharacterized protein n=1 Tax=Folsomia candida TaxID=158441 RepID=A0A226D1G6_FOLCA|nr:hypothetical protein Fcan01_26760 [Folsomia candida]